MAIEVRPHVELEKFCKQYSTIRAAAQVLECRANFLGEVLRRRRDVPSSLLTKLGLRKAVIKA
jgi:hypothetical protein